MNDTLKKLRLDGNKFGRIGGLAIAGALQVNTTLEELDVNNTEQVDLSLKIFILFNKKNEIIAKTLKNTVKEREII